MTAFLAGAPIVAQAHAFLDHAVPGVGATVGISPNELELTFTEDVVPSLSGVTIATAGGGAVPVSKPTGKGATLHFHLGRPLAGGTYVVTWHAVSVDTHRTSGNFKFTVAP